MEKTKSKMRWVIKQFIGSLFILPLLNLANAGVATPPNSTTITENKGFKIDSLDNLSIPAEIKTKVKQEKGEMDSKGYIDVSAEDFAGFEAEYAHAKDIGKVKPLLRPLDQISQNLRIKPAKLDEASIFKLKFEGALAGGSPENQVMLARFFTTVGGAVVRLEEFDFAASGGGTTMAKELVNASVNGHPAVLTIKQNPGSGNALTMLSWATDQKLNTLVMTENVKKKGLMEKFLALANSIQD